MASRLREAVVRFNWVAFYLVADGRPRMLVLGPFSGIDSPHKEIPFGRGVCGAAAASGKTIVVQDVKQDPRYLPDSEYTRSEIVVPIFAFGKVAGEIDVNSFFPAAFDESMQELLQQCAWLVSMLLERSRQAIVARSTQTPAN
jgi:GAF domain-containing protein